MSAPVLVLNTTTKKEDGPKVQLDNIEAAKVSQCMCMLFGSCSRLSLMLFAHASAPAPCLR